MTAVVLNVTAIRPTQDTYLKVYPGNGPQPTTSVLNLRRGDVRANSVTASVGSDGTIAIANAAGDVDVAIDVSGYYQRIDTAPSWGLGYETGDANRAYDSRTTPDGPIPPHSDRRIYVNGSLDESQLALVANITAIAPGSDGYLTAWSGQGTRPNTSTVNFSPGRNSSNTAVVPVNVDGSGRSSLVISNSSASPVHVAVDLSGHFAQNSVMHFIAVPPTRLIDTRSSSPLGQNVLRNVPLPASVDVEGAYAVVGNLTAVAPSQGTYLTAWSADFDAGTGTSNVNAAAGEVISGQAWTNLAEVTAPPSRFGITNASGSTNVVYDLQGVFVIPW